MEFGDKAPVVDNADGVTLDDSGQVGNQADATQLAPAIARSTGTTRRAAPASAAMGGTTPN
ncbi:hypothetical protein [Mycobacterium marinum]|uniref:hypothetical protein n=1 Tax=Mycobacterium marinum TaxID=1781 RepID=UPI003B42C138